MNNFKILLCITFIGLILSCNTKNEMSSAYQIDGKIEGLQNGQAYLANLDLVTNERVNVDSTAIVNGKFSFTGALGQPYLHTIFLNNDEDKVHFFLENSKIKISGNLNDLEHAKIVGSREDSLFHSYKTDDIFDRKKGMEIMLNYPDYAFSAFTAYYQFQMHNIQIDTLSLIMNRFEDTVKKSIYFQHLSTLYKTIKSVSISQPAPLFSIPDTTGEMVRLDNFKGKYILLDFWASWCAPCRAANPELVKVHENYSNRNFEIIGISVDKSEQGWKKAIKADELPWINVSNLKGWDEVSNIYGVKAVPQNFLLDPNGIIIDKNIEPEKLAVRLDKILPVLNP